MLVNVETFGRTGNRLFLDAHLTAFGWKHGIPVVNLAMTPLGSDLPHWGPRPVLARSLMWKAASVLPGSRHFRYWGDQDLEFDKQDLPNLLGPLRRGRTVFLHAWKFRGFESVARFRDRLIDRYRPTEAIMTSAHRILADARTRGETVVGVHVRWEDYRGTPYFLEAPEYRRQMERMVDLMAPQRIVFLVFSNEPVPEQSFPGLQVLFSHGTAFEDLYSMAQCDYLLAPPSTFSGWASFYGGVPLHTLANGGKVEIDGFSVVKG